MSDDNSFDELSYLREEVKRLRRSLNIHTPGLPMLLKRRGFHVYKKEPSEDLLLPSEEMRDDYYTMLHRYSFRLFLRDVIKHQDFFTLESVTRYATAKVTGEYLDYLLRLDLVHRTVNSGGTSDHIPEQHGIVYDGTPGDSDGYALFRRIKSFGETLEWYVAEVFKREFGADAIWGIKFKRPRIGGDYDVIAKFDGSVFYVEVKSSPPKQIYDSEISAFLDRVSDLSPEVAVFFVDTELRMKDKIVPMFEAELGRRSPGPPGVMRIEKELFQIQDRIFIINAKDSILRNIETVLNWYFRR